MRVFVYNIAIRSVQAFFFLFFFFFFYLEYAYTYIVYKYSSSTASFFNYVSPFFSLSLLLIVITQIRDHKCTYQALVPSLHYVPCLSFLFFYGEKTSALFFPRRLASNCALYPHY